MTRLPFNTIILFILFAGMLRSQTNQSAELSSILNSDGTVKTGMAGSFNVSGFEMKLDPSGEPVFKPSGKPNSTSSTVEWGKFYTGDGNEGSFTNGNRPIVYAIAVDGSNVYIGGDFTLVAGIKCNYIAKWDGTNWSALGNGTNGIVYTILINSGTVYAGGGFTTAGTVGASRIAKWNGTAWSAMGSGFTDYVKSLAIYNDTLFAGGGFLLSGGTTVNRIAKWNGTAWMAVGGGVTSSGAFVSCLAASADRLFIGGSFSKVGTVSMGNMAQWDGTAWSSVGSGSNSAVSTLLYSNGSLYAGGNFSSPALYIARWNGATWSALGSGMNTYVRALATDGTNIYAAGEFTSAGGTSANRIAMWNGTSWSALSTGLSWYGYSLAWDGTKLLAGGQFPLSFVTWNGSAFSTTDNKIDKPSNDVLVTSICVIGNSVYIAGVFNTVSGVAANNLAKWDGSNWSALGSGSNGAIQAISTDGTNLYAGGQFTSIGGVSTQGTAMWNGSNWSALDGGIPGTVYDIIWHNGSLYAGGSFNTVDGTNVAAKMIARWDGSNWYTLGAGVNSTVYAVAASGTDIYVGGEFGTAGSVAATKIAKWNGTDWSALGTGLSAAPSDIKISGSDLYAGGGFATAGGITVNGIARWDITSSTWNALGAGVIGSVYTMTIVGGQLYAGGTITAAGGGAVSFIAKWTGSAWASLGSSLDGHVYSIVPSLEYQCFLVGGVFTGYSTESIAKRIAKFTDSDNPLPVELTSFSGSFFSGAVQLNWQTATEVDNYGFEIEKKDTYSDWKKLSLVEGHGTCNSPKYYSFVDESVTAGNTYSYRLKQIDGDGSFTYSHIINISTGAVSGYTLEQNFPNPVSTGTLSGNSETVIRFELPVAGSVRLDVFNTSGEKVATVVEGFREAGVHSHRFNAKGLASGIYFYTLEAGDKRLTGKMMFLR